MLFRATLLSFVVACMSVSLLHESARARRWGTFGAKPNVAMIEEAGSPPLTGDLVPPVVSAGEPNAMTEEKFNKIIKALMAEPRAARSKNGIADDDCEEGLKLLGEQMEGSAGASGAAATGGAEEAK